MIGYRKFFLLLTVVNVHIGVFFTTEASGQNKVSQDNHFELSKNMEVYANIFKELNTYYVDPINPGELTSTSINAMLNELDPYTNYITESDIEDLQFMTTGKYGGIGASLKHLDGYNYVVDIYENSPSRKAGIRVGDKILMIDGKSMKAKSVDDISLLLKGSPGTSVTLKVVDVISGKEVDKVVVRAEIEVTSVPYASLIGEKEDIAYVRLNQFTQNCSQLLKKALDSLKLKAPQMRGVILDLRGNPGGLLDEAVNVCNLFLNKGQLVVSTKGKVKEWDKNFNTEYNTWDNSIPVAVLINGGSASASEIVSGTLQDLDRGVVVGSKSFGKGLVQTTRPIGFNARLKLTTAKYYTPSGRCIQAIDYSHRNEKGVAEKISDSMMEMFTTKGGRKVYGGGGVKPDILIDEEQLSTLGGTLYAKNLIFDYVTEFVKKNTVIPPVSKFAFSNNDFDHLTKWLSTKEYNYKTKTEVLLDSLSSVAKNDKLFEFIKGDIASLQSKIAHDKQQDIQKNKSEIVKLVESEIVGRYYFQKGRIQQGLKNDSVVEKAIEVLSDKMLFKSILEGKKM